MDIVVETVMLTFYYVHVIGKKI